MSTEEEKKLGHNYGISNPYLGGVAYATNYSN